MKDIRSLKNEGILVSIALATYNGERFLRKQLDSLIDQTYSRLEIVISDDGSKDATHGILREYAQKDSRVTWDINPHPDGFKKNFERAIGRCTGQIIFLCDQDDVWHKDKIAKHVVAYEDEKVAWVYNKVILIDGNDKEIGYLEDTAPDYYRQKTALENTWGSCILGCATSYRAKDLHQVMPIGRYAPAHDSWIQLALYPKKAVCIDEYLQEYRIHENNTFGLGKEATKERELQAISENMRYLKDLPSCRNLKLSQRCFFFVVYTMKRFRATVRVFMLG
jgi:glycosyltransferase involved in cell wall biosynthesis